MKRAVYLATMLALLKLLVAAPAMAQGAATDQYAAAAQYQYGAAGAQYGAAVLPPTGGLGLLPLAAGVALLLGGIFGGLALRGRLQRRLPRAGGVAEVDEPQPGPLQALEQG